MPTIRTTRGCRLGAAAFLLPLPLLSLLAVGFCCLKASTASAVVVLPEPEKMVFNGYRLNHPEDTGLWTANSDGTNTHQLPVNSWQPSLSPDAQKIVYRLSRDVWLTDTAGQERRLIATGLQYGSRPVEWSPDNESFIFDLNRATTGDDVVKLWRDPATNTYTTTALIGWGGSQQYPRYSSDGSKIVFTSSQGPNGENCCRREVYIADADGSNPRLVTTPPVTFEDPNEVYSAYGPSFSPDGSKIVFEGTTLNDTNSEIYVINVDGTGLHKVTSNDLYEYAPDWGPDGTIAFQREESGGSTYGLYRINADGTGETPLLTGWDFIDHVSFRKAHPELDGVAAVDQLDQYVPQMRYDTQELFRSLRVESITDNYNGSDSGGSNKLVRSDNTPIAYSNPTLGPRHLTSSFLNGPGTPLASAPYNTAPGEPSASVDMGDYIDETNSYEQDAQRWQVDPNVADVAYGRAFQDVDGRWWLQYWLFYYDNPDTDLTVGDHEGDWEMIQVGVDATTGVPAVTTYAQHQDSNAEGCAWPSVQKAFNNRNDLVPVVYPSLGSHASYYRAGSYGFPLITQERADGAGYTANLAVSLVGEDSPSWIKWPGRWGSSSPGFVPGTPSPMGPEYQGEKWTSPAGFNAQSRDCGLGLPSTGQANQAGVSESAKSSPKIPPPPKPTLSATRDGNDVVVQYAVPELKDGEASPKGLFVTVQPSEPSHSPSGKLVSLANRVVRVRIPVPLGPAPFTVQASAFSASGSRSQIAVTSVP